MQEVFGVLIFVVVIAGGVAAVLAIMTPGSPYDQIGRGGIYRAPEAEATPRLDDEDLRQLLDARNTRRVARGEASVDLDRELAELLRPAADPEVEAEVRALVESRNRRRLARGQAPLDVEAEVARRLRASG